MAHILMISHEPEAAPGVIGELLAEQGHEVERHIILTDPENPDTNFPDVNDFDAVIAFGSFSNVYDDKSRVWVEPEIELIRTTMRDDVPYLGLCFGGQLLTESLGGHVERAPHGSDEIGLLSIEPTGASMPIPQGPWFTWHEDRMVLPADVEILAETPDAVQLFRKGRAVGTQFHPEANVELVSGWIRIGPDHVPDYTSADQILGDLARASEATRANCAALLNWFLVDIAKVDA